MAHNFGAKFRFKKWVIGLNAKSRNSSKKQEKFLLFWDRKSLFCCFGLWVFSWSVCVRETVNITRKENFNLEI